MNDAVKDFFIFLGILVLMFFIWVFTGGPDRYISQKGPYLEPPAPLGSGDAYGIDPTLKYLPAQPGTLPPQTPTPSTQPIDPITGQVRPAYPYVPAVYPGEETVRPAQSNYPLILSRGKTSENGVILKEHLIIQNSSSAPVELTGTILEDGRGASATIGQAADLPVAGVSVETTRVILPPGGYAIVESGRSPVGVSFRVNKCSGYLGQFLVFSPALKRSCPSAAEEAPNELRYSCPAYLASIPRCTTQYQGAPATHTDATNECVGFAQTKLTYNSCVLGHQGDLGFKTNEWRIYLGKDSDLWANAREIRIYAPDKSILGILR